MKMWAVVSNDRDQEILSLWPDECLADNEMLTYIPNDLMAIKEVNVEIGNDSPIGDAILLCANAGLLVERVYDSWGHLTITLSEKSGSWSYKSGIIKSDDVKYQVEFIKSTITIHKVNKGIQ